MSVALASHGRHMGGLLGAGGLMLVLAGCAFLQSHQHGTGFSPTQATPGLEILAPDAEEPVISGPTETELAALDPTPVSEPSQTISSEAITRPQPRPDMALERPPSGPAHATAPEFAPAPTIRDPEPARVEPAIAQPQQVRPQPPAQPTPVQAESYPVRRADVIVKFRADPAIDQVISTWRRDRASAEAAFAAWAAADPLFSQMTIAGCSYSGELILSKEIGGGVVPAEAEVDTLTEQIRAHSAVAYADPDFTAHPGAGEK